jgi:hypothetical protein
MCSLWPEMFGPSEALLADEVRKFLTEDGFDGEVT